MTSDSPRRRSQGSARTVNKPEAAPFPNRANSQKYWQGGERSFELTDCERRPALGNSIDFWQPKERKPEQPLLVDSSGAAELLNVSEGTIRTLINRGVLTPVYLGEGKKRKSILRFRRGDIESLANSGITQQGAN